MGYGVQLEVCWFCISQKLNSKPLKDLQNNYLSFLLLTILVEITKFHIYSRD